MEANSSSKGSFAWKSITQAIRIVDTGLVWHVEDGKSIKIRGDKWLPSPHSSYIASPTSTYSSDSKVSALINEVSHTWNSNLILREFLAHEARIITSIPLSIHNSPNMQVWFPSSQGVYTTRSAYRLLSSLKRLSLFNCSNPGRRRHMWNEIWSLQVPHKIKHLMWKVANEAIPTLYNLWRRRVVQVVVCLGRFSDCEDTIHALWSYTALRSIWEADELKK